jgi:hypothetical protein
VACRTAETDEAVTVTVDVTGCRAGFDDEPQPPTKPDAAARRNTAISFDARLLFRPRMNIARASTPPGMMGRLTPPLRAALCAAELIIKVVDAVPGSITVAGVKVHEEPLGTPEQAKLTFPLNPFCGWIVTTIVPSPPARIVNDDEDIARSKVGGRLIV